MHTAIIAFDGFTDLDLFLPFDLMSRGGQFFPDIDFKVTLHGTKEHHFSKGGLKISMDGPIEAAAQANAVIVTSGPATRDLCRDQNYMARIKSALNPSRQFIASQCSGALILAAAEFLSGKTATTYPTAAKTLAEFGATVENRPFIAHGRVATAGGCLAGLALCHWLLRAHHGVGVADAILKTAQPVGAPISFAQWEDNHAKI